MITRSGGNKFRGSAYYWFRDNDLVGTEAKGLTYNPGTFDSRRFGAWASGPDHQGQALLLRQHRGRQADLAGHDLPREHRRRDGGRQRHARARLRPRPAELVPELELQVRHRPLPGLRLRGPGPALPGQARLQPERPQQDQRALHPARLEHRPAGLRTPPRSASAAAARARPRLNFANSNYKILENIKSGVAEWNSIIGSNKANSLIVGYTYQDESRESVGEFFPMVDILNAGTVYTTFGFEPFTPEQRAAVQDLPDPGQLHLEPRQPRVHVRRDRPALQVGERLLPRLAERLHLQLARRLLHRRERLPGEPEPGDLAGDPPPVPGALEQHPRAGEAASSPSRSGTRASTRRTSGRPRPG